MQIPGLKATTDDFARRGVHLLIGAMSPRAFLRTILDRRRRSAPARKSRDQMLFVSRWLKDGLLEEARVELGAFSAKRGIELVPFQDSFRMPRGGFFPPCPKPRKFRPGTVACRGGPPNICLEPRDDGFVTTSAARDLGGDALGQASDHNKQQLLLQRPRDLRKLENFGGIARHLRDRIMELQQTGH